MLFGKVIETKGRVGASIAIGVERLMIGFLQQMEGIVVEMEQSKMKKRKEGSFLPFK